MVLKNNILKIYFVGVKGVGMTPLAIIAKQGGIEVAGSDIEEEFITDQALAKEGIKPLVGFNSLNLTNFIKDTLKEEVLVISTSAHKGFDNPETKYAREIGIRVVSQGEAVGMFMDGAILGRDGLEGISVAGSHGKTTITAMLATYLAKLGLDPSYVVGTGEIFPIGAPGHYGGGKYFVAEADEYVSEIQFDRKSKFLYQKPKYAIFSNIDFDHPDFFRDIFEVERFFEDFSGNVDKAGFIVLNGDDTRLTQIKEKIKGNIRVVTFGSSPQNDFFLSKYNQSGFEGYFRVEARGITLGEFKLSVPGLHNAKNALSCIALLVELGISVSNIQKISSSFMGSKRRIEVVGKTKYGALIIDDYAHHPQEIKATLSAIKKAEPDKQSFSSNKKIICIFQPHTFSRTKALLADFVASFSSASYVILLPIFASMREDSSEYEDLSKQMITMLRAISKDAVFLKEARSVVEYIDNNFQNDSYIILTMGAGDVYKISQKLKSSSC